MEDKYPFEFLGQGDIEIEYLDLGFFAKEIGVILGNGPNLTMHDSGVDGIPGMASDDLGWEE